MRQCETLFFLFVKNKKINIVSLYIVRRGVRILVFCLKSLELLMVCVFVCYIVEIPVFKVILPSLNLRAGRNLLTQRMGARKSFSVTFEQI